MLIAQLTDTHVRARGRLAYGIVDTAAHLERAVAHLNCLLPAPDIVVVTGDLTDFDTPEEYGLFREIAGELKAPFYAVPGNHDSTAGLRAAFPAIAPMSPDGSVCYAADTGRLRVLMLDSTVAGAPHGELGTARLEWLDRALAAAPQRPALLALHHPPFRTGIRHMDVQNLRDAARLADVVRRHRQIVGIVCGHVHRPIQTLFAGVPASIGPSPAHWVSLDLSPAAPPTFHLEPPAIHLHLFDTCNGEASLLTHISTIGKMAGPFPFFDAGGKQLGNTGQL